MEERIAELEDTLRDVLVTYDRSAEHWAWDILEGLDR